MFNIRSSRLQFCSQKWILSMILCWRTLFNLILLFDNWSTHFCRTPFGPLKNCLFFLSRPALFFFLSQRCSLNINPRKWYLRETYIRNKKNQIFAFLQVIPDSNKIIDDQYLHIQKLYHIKYNSKTNFLIDVLLLLFFTLFLIDIEIIYQAQTRNLLHIFVIRTEPEPSYMIVCKWFFRKCLKILTLVLITQEILKIIKM